ncbi:MAG: hypothetical protein ACYTGH_11590 [Planctomycetota bacterium]|jgi:hypothetical protein
MSIATISASDRETLRALAERKAEIAEDPVNLERRQAWLDLDGGKASRPMILAEIGGLSDETHPCGRDRLVCEGDAARSLEHRLRAEIYQFEELKDDHVVEPTLTHNWQVAISDYGVEVVKHRHANEAGQPTAWTERQPRRPMINSSLSSTEFFPSKSGEITGGPWG